VNLRKIFLLIAATIYSNTSLFPAELQPPIPPARNDSLALAILINAINQDRYEVPLETALHVETFKSSLMSLSPAQERQIPIDGLSQFELEFLSKVLWGFHFARKLSGKAQLEAVCDSTVKSPSMEKYFKSEGRDKRLYEIAGILHYPQFAQLISYSFLCNNAYWGIRGPARFAILYPELIKKRNLVAAKELVRYFCLRYEANPVESNEEESATKLWLLLSSTASVGRCPAGYQIKVPLRMAGFSIRDYLDFRNSLINERHIQNSYNLSHLTIDNLEGLRSVPAIEECTGLNLSTNFLQSLPPLDYLTSLQALDLSNNRLTTLENGIALARLYALTRLNCAQNTLQYVSDDCFSPLTSLQELNLADNRLTSIPESFNRLTSLRVLKLQNNQLRIVPENILLRLTRLRELNLDGNQLQAAAPARSEANS
jgi:hypothetical protein